MRGSTPVPIRTAERRSRGGPNLLPDLRSPGGSRSRPGRAASSTTQVSMGNEWMFPIYQRLPLTVLEDSLRARLGRDWSLRRRDRKDHREIGLPLRVAHRTDANVRQLLAEDVPP